MVFPPSGICPVVVRLTAGIWTDDYEAMVEFYRVINNALKVSPEPVEGQNVTNFGNYLAIREQAPVTTNAEIVLIAYSRDEVDAAYNDSGRPGDPPQEIPASDGMAASYQWSVQDPAGNNVRVVHVE